MNKFHDSVAEYLALRRSLGFKMSGPEYILRQFAAFACSEEAPFITNELVTRWLEYQSTVTPATRSARLSTVRRFTIWQRGIDPRTEVPPEQMFYSRYERKRPYIYTQEEIQGILAEARKLPSKLGWRAQIHATYFGLLAATGMRMSEALALDRNDVDLAEGILTIRRTKFGKSRLVPIHQTTSNALKSHAQARDVLFPRLGTPAFFVSERKTRLSQWAVRYNFAKACSGIGLRAPFKGSRHGPGPRLHDLRHRFAVLTMVDWYRTCVDVERNMPKLSAYLGHTHGHDTYWYIEAVPELLQLATERLTKGTEEDAT